MWKVKREPDRLVVVFEGHLSEADGESSARAVADALSTLDSVVLVLDVERMTGYASSARRAWQEALAPHRARLREVRTRGASSLVRMGATVIGLFLGMTVVHE